MNATDVARAVAVTEIPAFRFCGAINTVLPVLRILREQASWTKPWVKVGLAVAIGALEAYAKAVCP